MLSIIFLAGPVSSFNSQVTIEQGFTQRVVIRRGMPRLGFLRVIGNPIILDTGYSEADLDVNKRAEARDPITGNQRQAR